jgi:hypothetical protein
MNYIKDFVKLIFNLYQITSSTLSISIILILYIESLDIFNYPRLWMNLDLKRTTLAMLIFIVPNLIYCIFKAFRRINEK